MSQSFKCKAAGQSAVLVITPDRIQLLKKGLFGRGKVLRDIAPAAITELEWRMGKQGTDEPNFFISYTENGDERIAALAIGAPGIVYAAVEGVRPRKDLGRQHGDIKPADLPTHGTRTIHPAPEAFGRQKPRGQRRAKK
ncbi:MAG: hypothetical protein AAGJ10_18460 [Bacteroidota bacterium]